MKRIVASILLAAMLLSLVACKDTPAEPAGTTLTTVPTVPVTQPGTQPVETDVTVPAQAGVEAAAAALQALYAEADPVTPVDYSLIGAVTVEGVQFPITWTTDAAEELVKLVVNPDGSVTVDVSETATEETPYVLTATVTDADGNTQTVTFDRILPAAIGEDMLSIVDAAYALAENQAMPNPVTLIGLVTEIDTPWSDQYQNISVVMAVPGREDKPIVCFRLKGEGAKELAIGDTVTVTGTLKNYYGTVEFDAGCTLDAVVKGGNVTPTAPEDPAEIVKAAYALKDGESLPYNATLTGRITSVDYAWDDNYGNITVTMYCEGRSIKCFRLKGDGAEHLGINDQITVTGVLTNYQGTIEFAAGCVLDHYVDNPAPSAPSDPLAIIDAAYQLKDYESLPYTATLTGVISSVDYAWSDDYGNITVTMKVAGREDKPIQCYRLTGTGAKDLKVGDTITVKGTLKNYMGTIEFDKGCELKAVVKGAEVSAPSDPLQIVDEAYQLKDYESLPYTATLTGVICQIDTPWDEGYANITVTMKVAGRENKPIMCYRLKGEGAKELAVGDTITVKGSIKNYMGTVEFNSGCVLLSVVKGEGGDVPTDPTEPEDTEPTEPTVSETVVPEEETAYKLGMVQGSLSKTLYITGNTANTSYYLETTEDFAAAVDVYLEQTEGGWLLYFTKDGVKTYIDVYLNGTYVNIRLTEEPTAVYTWNEDYQTFTTTVTTADGDVDYYLGTYGTYSTLSASKLSYISTSFPATLYTAEVSEPEETDPTEPETTEPEVTEPEETEPSEPETASPEENKAFKLGMVQGNLGTTLYITGNTANRDYYLETTEDITAAIDVYVEAVEGGWLLYFTKDGVKTYIDVYLNGTYVNIRLTEEPTAVYTWNEDYQTFTTTVTTADGDVDYYLGTYGTYSTLSASKLSYISTSFPATLYTVEDSEPETDPTEPSEPEQTDPTEPEETEPEETDPTEPEETEPEETEPEVTEPSGPEADGPQENTAYKLGMVQGNLGTALYITGNTANTSYYLETTEDIASAIDVYVEAVEGGWLLYFTKDGVKTYIDVYLNGTYVNIRLTEEPTAVYTWNEDYQTFTTTVTTADGDVDYYLGTYGTYSTLSASKLSYISTSFPATLYTVEDSEPETDPTEPSEPEETEPEETDPTEPEVTEPESNIPPVGVPYKLGMVQGNLGTTLYITGNTANRDYYLETTEDITAAIDVYVEAVEGGCRVYFTKDGVKTYIDVYLNGTYVNIRLTEEPTAVYTWNEDYQTFTTTVTTADGDVDYYLGTYGTYNTVSASKLSYISTSFPATLYTAEASEPEETEPTEPETTEPEVTEPEETEPSEPETASPEENKAFKLGMVQGNLGTTLYITGNTANRDYYLETTEDITAAIDVYVEAVEGGCRVYFTKDGVKTYIDVYLNGTYVNIRLTEEPTAVYTWNEDYQTFTTTVTTADGDVDYYLGTYGTYNTVSASKLSYISTSFPATLYTAE